MICRREIFNIMLDKKLKDREEKKYPDTLNVPGYFRMIL